MKRKKLFFIAGTIIFILIILIVLRIGVSRVISSPCGYINYAWGSQKGECDCSGIKIDTSCKMPDGDACPDYGSSEGCIGIVKERRCYMDEFPLFSGNWTQVSCL